MPVARPKSLSVASAARFAIVGAAATVTYVATTILLVEFMIGLEPTAASLIAFGISLLVSYLGHHQFTFKVSGRHKFYLPRFLTVSATLLGLSTAVMFFFNGVFGVDHRVMAAAIALSYPPASFLLNALWSFRLP